MINNSMSNIQLAQKLQDLKNQLVKLETEGVEEIRLRRIAADMGDDYRENEGAKLVMEEETMLYVRIRDLKKEIYRLRISLIANK